jgi:hypothetical protein
MCLTEVGLLHRGLKGAQIDLEPRSVPGAPIIYGRLVDVRTVPGCNGFRHLTIRLPETGTDAEAVVPVSLLVYVYCRGRKALLRPDGSTDTKEST